MNRRSFVAGAFGGAGIVTAGCIDIDSEDWEMVQHCTEEVSVRVDSVGTALEEWLQSPETFDASRFDRLADETETTLDDCESDIRERYEEIEDETIVPDEELDQHDGHEIVSLLQDLLETAHDGQTAAIAVAQADAEPRALDDAEEDIVESVAEDHEEVLEDVEPILAAET